MATYTGNLTATLSVRKVKLPLSTLRELADHEDFILRVGPGTAQELLFKVLQELCHTFI